MEVDGFYSSKPGWKFIPVWVIGNWIGLVAGFFSTLIFLHVMRRIFGEVQNATILLAIYLPFTGLAVGLIQGILLRPYISHFWGWVLVTLLAFTAGAGLSIGLAQGLSAALVHNGRPGLPQDILFPVFGLFLGLGQWYIIRCEITRSGWWVLANFAGLILPVLLVGKGQDVFSLHFFYGITTGLALFLLLQLDRR